MNYTPGPWKVDRPYIRGAGRAIASLESWHNEVEDAANARLIAAAPELYEAVQTVDMALAGQKTSLEEWANISKTVRAALAKARGEAAR